MSDDQPLTRERLENQLVRTLEHMSDAFYMLDPHWNFTYLNRTASQILKRSCQELAGHNIWTEFPEVVETALYASYRDAMASGRPCQLEVYDPTLREWFDVRGYPSEDGLAVYFRPVLQSERQLQEAQRMEAIGQLTGGMAHDFNNLLTVILGNAELLQETLDGQPALQSMATVVIEAAHKGADLTRRLLAFARRQALAPAATCVNDLLPDLQALLARTLGNHISLTVHTAPSLWPALVDPVQLESTLLNLCLNARDAMPEGGLLTIETANIQVRDRQTFLRQDLVPGDYVRITVTDTGNGIAPEVLDRVFEPFFSTKTDGGSTGLGLSMVYGFMKQSGGHISLHSAPDEGTRVLLYLPRSGETADDTPAVSVRKPALSPGDD